MSRKSFRRTLSVFAVCGLAHGQDLLVDWEEGVDESGEWEALDRLVVDAGSGAGQSALFGSPLTEDPLLAFATGNTSVLEGKELRRKLGATLGETLANEPGISASSYSPGVSRPVIRGFDGVRVRMLRDGLSTMDLSQDNPDHGVLVDTLMAESIEIHRGPSSLMFGNSAIGGAVNTRTRYIPSAEGEAQSFALLSGYETQGNGRFLAGAGEIREGKIAIGVSASLRKAGDISIPGQARTQAYENAVNPDVFIPGTGTVGVVNPDGTLPNSGYEQQSGSIGIRVGDPTGWWLGFSHHDFRTDYGIPYFYPGDATDFYGDYGIDASLRRSDWVVGWIAEEPRGVKEVRLRLGVGDYEHDENFTGLGKDAGTNFTETSFETNSRELRFELFHEFGDFDGVVGFHAVSDEVEVTRLLIPPPTIFEETSVLDSQSVGVFALQKWQRGPWSAQAGLRWDSSEVSSTDQLGSKQEADGSSFSQSIALGYEFEPPPGLDLLRVDWTGSHVERLPTAIERYAFFNNASLGRFVIGGDFDGSPLDTESSLGTEMTVSAERGDLSASLSAFYYDYRNFVYLQDQAGVSFAPTAMYVSTPAEFYGLEMELNKTLWEGDGILDGSLFGDIMRGVDQARDQPLPRIPAARFGGGLTWEADSWSASLDARYVFEKTQTSSYPTAELSTDDYLMVNASVSWRPLENREELELTLKLHNLLDQEARDATSFRKDTAPLAGFGMGLEARWIY
ncbi:MAG: TonB-dependent receptor [Verrucomicrobiales bacterium]